MRHRLSGSKRPLAAHCLYWAREDVEVPPRCSSAAADLGSAKHEASEEDSSAAEADGDDDWDLTAALADGIDVVAEKWGLNERQRESLESFLDVWNAWWPGYSAGREWLREAPFAYDTTADTAGELPTVEGERRAYNTVPSEYPCTLDAYSPPDADGEAVVLDIKTGRGPHTLAEHLPQLELGALCSERAHGAERVRVVIAWVTEDDVRVDERLLDAFDIEVAASAMRAEVVAVAEAAPSPGAHCRGHYCPAMAVCPVTQAELATVPAARHLPVLAVNSAGDLAALLDGLPRIEAWAKEMRRKGREFADGEGGAVELPDGTVYRRRDVATERFTISPRAEAALRGELGPAADEAVKKSITKASIERVARAIAGKGEIAKTKERAIEALRGAGAAKVSTHLRYERKPAAKAAE